jgi:geranylgeranyl pyrophosphate synthase
MTVIPTSAAIEDCAINRRHKSLIGFHMGKQMQILSGDALRSTATTVMREIIGSNWKEPLR